MKIDIRYCYNDQVYYWTLYDGPDGIDIVEGSSYTLGQAFEQIVQQRLVISQNYN